MVGIGRSIHAGMVIVADGTAAMAERLERVLTNDPVPARCATPTPVIRKQSKPPARTHSIYRCSTLTADTLIITNVSQLVTVAQREVEG